MGSGTKEAMATPTNFILRDPIAGMYGEFRINPCSFTETPEDRDERALLRSGRSLCVLPSFHRRANDTRGDGNDGQERYFVKGYAMSPSRVVVHLLLNAMEDQSQESAWLFYEELLDVTK